MLYKNTDNSKSYIRLKQEIENTLKPYIKNIELQQYIFVSTNPKTDCKNIITCGWYRTNIIDYIVAESETICNIQLTADGGLHIQSYRNNKLYNQFYIYLLSEEGWDKINKNTDVITSPNPNNWVLLK